MSAGWDIPTHKAWQTQSTTCSARGHGCNLVGGECSEESSNRGFFTSISPVCMESRVAQVRGKREGRRCEKQQKLIASRIFSHLPQPPVFSAFPFKNLLPYTVQLEELKSSYTQMKCSLTIEQDLAFPFKSQCVVRRPDQGAKGSNPLF